MNSRILKHLKNLWKGWGYSIFIALILTTSLKSAIADWNVVPTGSMNPTILEGDRIFVNKLAYDLKIPYTTIHIAEWSNPQRGDIVVFYSPEDGTRLVKRVVGLPGDRIAMRRNQLIINGEPLQYSPIGNLVSQEALLEKNSRFAFAEHLAANHDPHPVQLTPQIPAIRSFSPFTVPENSYFMMGDNRDNSADSRYFGPVERKLIVGQATSVVISLDINNGYNPRWDRFFTKLL